MNGSSVSFKEALAQLPTPGPLWQITVFADLTSGIEIQMAVSTSDVLVTPIFRGAVVAATPAGHTSINFDIPGTTLEEARVAWPTAAKAAILEFNAQLEAAQSRIIVPSAPAPFPKSKVPH